MDLSPTVFPGLVDTETLGQVSSDSLSLAAGQPVVDSWISLDLLRFFWMLITVNGYFVRCLKQVGFMPCNKKCLKAEHPD